MGFGSTVINWCPFLLSASAPCLQAGGRQLAKAVGPMDGQLFVIRHLLHLREQISAYDVDYAVTDVDLDFSHMRDHVRRIITGTHC